MTEKNEGLKRRTIRKVLRYVSSYWYYLAGSILLALAVVILTLCVPLLTGDAIDCIIGAGQVDFPALTRVLRRSLSAAASRSGRWRAATTG